MSTDRPEPESPHPKKPAPPGDTATGEASDTETENPDAGSESLDRWLPALRSTRDALPARAPNSFLDRLGAGSDSESAEREESTVTFPASTDNRGRLGQLQGFEIEEVLGEGGFGIVYRALDRELARPVAIKVLKPEHAASREHRTRFEREARAASSVRNDHVVTIHHVGEPDEEFTLPWFVMELVEGSSLKQLLSRHRTAPGEEADEIPPAGLPESDCLRILQEVAEGVAAANAVGLIHRDIKPANILIEEATGRAKITDFGLARDLESDLESISEGKLAGAPAYMSPEQIRSPAEIDQRSDVYAIGVVLFELTTGVKPFRGSGKALLLQIANEDPPTPRRFQPELSVDLETVILKCLSTEPDGRYESAGEVAAELKRIQNHLPILARPLTGRERLQRWRRRNPRLARTSLALAMSLLLGITATSSFGILALGEARRANGETQRAKEATKVAEGQTGIANAATLRAEKNRKEMVKQRDAAIKARDKAEKATATAVRETDRAEQNLYESQLSLAELEWVTGNSRGGNTYLLQDYSAAELDRRLAGPATQTLLKCQETRRGWEWHYLRRRFHGGQRSLLGHERPIRVVRFHPDGLRLASGGEDGSVFLWDANGTRLQAFEGHQGEVSAMTFSPDGKQLVTGGADRTVRFWSVESGEMSSMLVDLPGAVLDVEFHPSEKVLAIAGGIFFKGYDAYGKHRSQNAAKKASGFVHLVGLDGTLLRELVPKKKSDDEKKSDEELAGHPHVVADVAFHSGRIATASWDNTARLWDFNTGDMIAELPHKGIVTSVEFSSDGSRLATAAGGGFKPIPGGAMFGDPEPLPGEIRVWDVETKKPLWTTAGHRGIVNRVRYLTDSVLVSCGEYAQVRLWDAESGDFQETLRGHVMAVAALDLAREGSVIATGGADETIRLWNPVAPQFATRLTDGSQTGSVSFSRDDRDLAVCTKAISRQGGKVSHKSRLQILDVATGEERHRMAPTGVTFSRVAFSPVGDHLVATASALARDETAKDGEKKVRSVEVVFLFADWNQKPEILTGHTAPVWTLAFAPDGKHFATASWDNSVRVWSIDGKCLHVLKAETGLTGGVAFSPDSQQLATGGSDGAIRLWNVSDGSLLTTLLPNPTEKVNGEPKKPSSISAVSFSPDGRYLAAASGHRVQILDRKTGRRLHTLTAHNVSVAALSFQPKGNRLAVASADGTISLWDTGSFSHVYTLRGHTAAIQCLEFSHDGHRLVSGSGHLVHLDGETLLWDASPLWPDEN